MDEDLTKEMQVIQERTCIYGNHNLVEDGMPKMRPLKSRIDAIQKVKPPKTIKECRSFCGMVNYMSMFLPSLQEKLIPYTS